PEDAQAAEPPRRGHPPNAAEQPKVVRHTLSGSGQPKEPPSRLLCQSGRFLRAAAPASAAAAARQSRPTEPPSCAALQPDRRSIPPKNQHTEL
ncbi:MAG: hypothetical protein ACK56F_31180, partial [bacterium]